jgi:hypothetical protein
MTVFEALMLLGAGLFAGGALTFAWSRVPIWRRMPLPQFVDDFAQTLSRTDKIQPALLLTGAASAAAFAATSEGAAAVLAVAGAAGLVLVLIGSLAVLVPLQRRLIAIGARDGGTIEEMRARWFRGNLGRSLLATVSFALIAAASAA